MSRGFRGVWGTFAYIDDAAHAIEALQGKGMDYNVLSPFPHHELHHAMGSPQSKIPFIPLIFGALGLFFGYALPTWTSMDWVLPVSGKPIVSIPPYTIIGFELMVLLGGVSTAIGIFVMGFLDLARKRLPRSERFKQYRGFAVDRFGVVVRCEDGQADEVEGLLREHNAEEVVRET